MKLKSNMYINLGTAKTVLTNLWNRIKEIEDPKKRMEEFDIMHKHIRALANQEERVVDWINKEMI